MVAPTNLVIPNRHIAIHERDETLGDKLFQKRTNALDITLR
jgi:hypothetical protein